MAISDIFENSYPSTIRIPPVLILLHLSQHEVLYQSLQPETSLLAAGVLFLRQDVYKRQGKTQGINTNALTIFLHRFTLFNKSAIDIETITVMTVTVKAKNTSFFKITGKSLFFNIF